MLVFLAHVRYAARSSSVRMFDRDSALVDALTALSLHRK